MSQLEKWAQLAQRWHEQGPPATPSPEDIENFSSVLRAYLQPSQPTIGILGCTPSLRARMHHDWPNSRIVLIDFCREMYEATSALLDDGVKDSEDYLVADWLEMSSSLEGEVDAFIGDKSLDNVEMQVWDVFFRSVERCLKAGGLLVLHIGLPDSSLAGQSFESLAQPWVESITNTGLGIDKAAAGLWEDLLSGSADNTRPYLSLEPYRNQLAKYSRSADMIGSLSARVLADFASQLDARWTNFDKNDVITAAASSELQHIEERFSHDYQAARNQPIMVFGTSAPEI